MSRPTKERIEEIREESTILGGTPFSSWFCSDHIKSVLTEMLAEIDALTEELKAKNAS